MKIKKIIFEDHPLFPSWHEVIFEQTSGIPTIAYLIGNNGTGKTQILETIYWLFWESYYIKGDIRVKLYIELTPKEHEINDQNLTFIFSYHKRWGSIDRVIVDENGQSISKYIDLKSISKIVYSTIEVNFANTDIKTITAKNIDNEIPKEKSSNLNTEIPQLLVDISSLDDSEIASWVRDNPWENNADCPEHIWSRLRRFTNAFHKIYNGTKKFDAIKNEDNKKIIIFKDEQNREVDISKFSSGEQQILYRIWYILKNLGTMDWWIILIDEPEISLHPIRQERLRELLLELFDQLNIQIILTTHSPYIFRKVNDDNWKEVCIKVDSSTTKSCKVQITFPWLKYTPSPNYISYVAYGIYNKELHIELYEQLLIKYRKNWPSGLDKYLKKKKNINEPIKQRFTKQGESIETEETIMTRIRNKIHHPTETNRPNYNDEDLKESIDRMIQILTL